jgi:phosphoglycerate dehydrogenase-like enzyme
MRVGLPAEIDPSLFRHLPAEVEVVRIAADENVPAGESALDLDIWVLPLFPRQAALVRPRIGSTHVVQSLLAGVDAYLPLIPNGATLCDAQGVHDLPVAEWIVGVVLAMLKYLPFYLQVQAAGDWSRRTGGTQIYRDAHPEDVAEYPAPMEEELAGSRVLIVGYGSIGRAVEERLAPFGVTVERVSRRGRQGVESQERLDELLPHADIVILLVPLTGDTRGMMDSRRLAAMKHGALLVNAARGPVVDTQALDAALRSGSIRAAIDVTDPEPLPAGHPLWSAPNLLITPHIAGASPRFMERAMALVGEQCRRYLAGEPLAHIVRDGY